MMRPFTLQRGFSALDILVTMALVATVLAVGVPIVGTALKTYQRNGAARHVLAEIRRTQSVAVARGGTFGLQWGAASGVKLQASQYRIVRDTTGSCAFPSVSSPRDDVNVIHDWRDLTVEYSDVTIQSIRDQSNSEVGELMFDSLGASTNTCANVNFPVTVTVSDASGNTRLIEIGSAGTARIL